MEFDVVELPEADHPEPGDTAPDFTRPLVTGEYWSDTSLAELSGPVVLVFYPMDGAFPATYIWNELRDRSWNEHATVVGVSISTPYEHTQFIQERSIDYRLFSDPTAAVATRYGLEHNLDGMHGITEHRPAVFVLDDDRTVRDAWVASEWPDFPDYDELEASLADV